MKKKINLRLFFIGMLSLFLTATLVTFVFHSIFDRQVKADMQTTTKIISESYQLFSDPNELRQFSNSGLRLTLVSAKGNVLFESEQINSQEMENHLTRPEILAAINTGFGEATRKSQTIGYNTYYNAIRLRDGNILRVSKTVANLYSIYNKALPAVVGVGIVILLISLFLSSILTTTIIAPIEAMAKNLDDVERLVPYKELEPSAQAIKLQQLRRKENERIRQEFTANVSHELKTPLTSISGYAEMIQNGMARSEDIKSFATKIYNEAARLVTLIGDIIKLSELDEMNRKEQAFAKVDLRPIVEETIESLNLVAAQHGITFKTTGTHCIVWGQQEMLEELIYNLCDNAIRYNKPNGTITLSLGEQRILAGNEEPILIDESLPASKDQEDLDANGVTCNVLSVADTGIGIPTEHQERVFERFYRVDKSRSKETGGTGLGLAIVKHIALCHHARILLHSKPGIGTQIDIIFP